MRAAPSRSWSGRWSLRPSVLHSRGFAGPQARSETNSASPQRRRQPTPRRCRASRRPSRAIPDRSHAFHDLRQLWVSLVGNAWRDLRGMGGWRQLSQPNAMCRALDHAASTLERQAGLSHAATPPRPTSVSSRMVFSSARTSVSSRARPTTLLSWRDSMVGAPRHLRGHATRLVARGGDPQAGNVHCTQVRGPDEQPRGARACSASSAWGQVAGQAVSAEQHGERRGGHDTTPILRGGAWARCGHRVAWGSLVWRCGPSFSSWSSPMMTSRCRSTSSRWRVSRAQYPRYPCVAGESRHTRRSAALHTQDTQPGTRLSAHVVCVWSCPRR